MSEKGVTKRVKGMVDKAKDMIGLGGHETEEKVKHAIDRTAEKAKGAVHEASGVVSEGADKAKEVVKQVGQKVKDAGERIKTRGD